MNLFYYYLKRSPGPFRIQLNPDNIAKRRIKVSRRDIWLQDIYTELDPKQVWVVSKVHETNFGHKFSVFNLELDPQDQNKEWWIEFCRKRFSSKGRKAPTLLTLMYIDVNELTTGVIDVTTNAFPTSNS